MASGSQAGHELARLVSAFNRNGVLTKVTGCSGDWCERGNNNEHAHAWLNATLRSRRLPPDAEHDCGEQCSAFVFLSPDIPVTPFSKPDYKSGLMLVYDASDELWRHHVQCMAVTDSVTSTRVCGSCSDPHLCPWYGFPHSEKRYCHAPCTTDACKQIAAGCGPSLFDVAGQASAKANGGHEDAPVSEWGSDACSRAQITRGRCSRIKVPYWCRDDKRGSASNSSGLGGGLSNRVRTPTQWMENFFDRDGHASRPWGTRQCKWKPSQKRLFVDAIRLRFGARAQKRPPSYDHGVTWNEVNMHVDASGVLARALWANLLGLVYVRTAGDAHDLRGLNSLARHWRSLGVDVPTFAMDAELLDRQIRHWSPHAKVQLEKPPYSLHAIPLETEA